MDPSAAALATLVADYYLADTSIVLELMKAPEMKRAKIMQSAPAKNPYALAPLSDAQLAVLDGITQTPLAALREHLIWGVTGSGKTRIYEHLIAQTIENGGQAILLLPEIALSGQIMRIIAERFGKRAVLYHSGLAKGERAEAYQRFASGDAQIALGTRSAIFLPAKTLRLMIIDEEHDASFKDQRNFRFDTRTVARLRQTLEGDLRLVLGSATPTLETLARAKSGEAKLHRLNYRATGQKLPTVHIPDYKQQHGIIAPFLQNKMREHLAAGNQVLLLMNRRGHSTHVHCPTCDGQPAGGAMASGYAQCPRCAVALTYHKDRTLKCHHCGYRENYNPLCPKDGTERRLTGRGIQRVEEILDAQFPGHPYARLDRDTASRKGFVEEVLLGLKERTIDILIGTQMIAKGFDLEGVTLVGVLAIDAQLTAPDFRAAESAWQLLAQVVGRSGRHLPGEVVIQTMSPEHYAIRAVREHNADEFYAAEANFRRLTHYPPFGALARLVLSSSNEELLFATAEKLRREIAPVNTVNLFASENEGGIDLLGPALPALTKKDNIFRVHFLIKSISASQLRAYLLRTQRLVERVLALAGSVSYYLDIDPRELN